MKWLRDYLRKWLLPYHESDDFNTKLRNLKVGSVIWLNLRRDYRPFSTCFIVMDIGDGYLAGDALIMNIRGVGTTKIGMKIDFKNISYLTNTDVNIIDRLLATNNI